MGIVLNPDVVSARSDTQASAKAEGELMVAQIKGKMVGNIGDQDREPGTRKPFYGIVIEETTELSDDNSSNTVTEFIISYNAGIVPVIGYKVLIAGKPLTIRKITPTRLSGCDVFYTIEAVQ